MENYMPWLIVEEEQKVCKKSTWFEKQLCDPRETIFEHLDNMY